MLVYRMAQAVPSCVLSPAEVPEAPDCSQTWVANQPGTGCDSSLLPISPYFLPLRHLPNGSYLNLQRVQFK